MLEQLVIQGQNNEPWSKFYTLYKNKLKMDYGHKRKM